MEPGILWFFVISKVYFRDGQKTHPGSTEWCKP
jgi:hypothetical protein